MVFHRTFLKGMVSFLGWFLSYEMIWREKKLKKMTRLTTKYLRIQSRSSSKWCLHSGHHVYHLRTHEKWETKNTSWRPCYRKTSSGGLQWWTLIHDWRKTKANSFWICFQMNNNVFGPSNTFSMLLLCGKEKKETI